MNKVRRIYNLYKVVIWKCIGIIVGIVLILQVLNYFTILGNNRTANEINGAKLPETDNVVSDEERYDKVNIGNDTSLVDGSKLTEVQKTAIDTINDFYKYCENNQIEEAYDLLSDKCKEQLYSDVATFKELYIDLVLQSGDLDIIVENWVGSTYKITVMKDVLSQGTIGNGHLQEYITTTKVGDEYKLNISGYVMNNEINKSTVILDVEIKVIESNTYMDYEVYTLHVINSGNQEVILDTLLDISDIYIEDENGAKYSAYTQEIIRSDLSIPAKTSKPIYIKFYSNYVSTKNIVKLLFSNAIVDGQNREIAIEI